MNLLEISQAINRPVSNITCLLYGKAKAGKSTLAATIAKVKRIKTIHWFDCEHNIELLVNLVKLKVLTHEEAAKIIVYQIDDSVEHPYAFETLGKLIGVRRPLAICDAHGRVDCPQCTKDKKPVQVFDMSKCDDSSVIVIDSGSQYSDSILHYYNEGKLVKGTAGMDAYREQGLRLVEFLTEVQRAKTNWVVITHELAIEVESGTERIAAMDYKGPKTEIVMPLIGTKPFSMKVGKYFSHVAYLEVKLRKHIAGSSTTYKAGVLTGSRTNWHIEDQKALNMLPLFGEAEPTEKK